MRAELFEMTNKGLRFDFRKDVPMAIDVSYSGELSEVVDDGIYAVLRGYGYTWRESGYDLVGCVRDIRFRLGVADE